MDAISETSKKPLFELGRFVATLLAFGAAMKLLGVATQEDMREIDRRLIQTRARVDVIGVVVQTQSGARIFWDTLESEERGLAEIPSGPVAP